MKRIRINLFLFFTLLFCSCSGIKQSVKGFWSIDSIEYKSQNLLFDLRGNSIIFKSNECVLPRVNEGNELKANSETGTWEVIKQGEKYFLRIKTENELFKGTHQICFKKDYEKKLIKMIITSKDLSIECSKWLVNFDKENEGIDEYLCKEEP